MQFGWNWWEYSEKPGEAVGWDIFPDKASFSICHFSFFIGPFPEFRVRLCAISWIVLSLTQGNHLENRTSPRNEVQEMAEWWIQLEVQQQTFKNSSTRSGGVNLRQRWVCCTSKLNPRMNNEK
jgi:hypothetical protein